MWYGDSWRYQVVTAMIPKVTRFASIGDDRGFSFAGKTV